VDLLQFVALGDRGRLASRVPPQVMFEAAKGFLRLDWFPVGDDPAVDAAKGTTWIHVSLTNQNSWAAEFMELTFDTDATNRRLAHEAGNVALRCCLQGDRVLAEGGEPFAALGIENNPRFFKGFAFEDQCFYTVFVLAEGDRIVSEFLPCEVEVRCAGTTILFWPGSAAAEGSTARAGAKLKLKRQYTGVVAVSHVQSLFLAATSAQPDSTLRLRFVSSRVLL
jgi:hypothetical protein